ncbi:disintegrin and metalloproteinase domain-containing protein 10-like isoform X3 [Branchiostoma floridae]|uniref:ADAM10 endopeptidase n=1 Tax=Branchiostoma floridae TaxID=7739 RepID=A0A9J7KUJ7_BRAFL|nr:disintegrin and metalloproteinase domain-containing protein 10-like isoform X3 [Branchiostoma floridae]
MIVRVFSVLVVLGLVAAADAGRKLNQYIHHFEPLNYDTADLHTRHQRAKRSANLHEQFVHLEFHAHGRHFNLRLKRDTSVFSPDFKLQTENGEEDYDTSHIYSGGLYGYPDTVAHGSIIDGRFEGFVYAHHGKYYMEPAERYFDGPQRFHSVMYMDQDINYPHRYGPYGGCGMNQRLQDWMEAVQNSAVEEENSAPEKDVEKEPVQQSRKKRAVGSPEVLEKGSCEMYIQADHKFYQYFQTRDAVIGQISSHIKAINLIYKDVIFADSTSGGITGVTFTVRRVKVNETSGCSDPGGPSCNNPFAPDNIGVERFLEINSEANHDDYCLAYVFTDRDFDDGVLGLAWVGSASGSSGGICEKYKKYSDGKYKSLNTGIVTIHNYGSHVPPKVSHITFAHEVGHNFGSPHDTDLNNCAPGGESGNYIMYARATSGDKANNNKFSSCSKGSIHSVLDAKIVGNPPPSTSCFTETNAAICGNGIVEEGEQCDCGYSDHCQRTGEDNCCVPAGNPNPCTLQPGKACSPSQGPCCTSQCTPKPSTVECSKESECSASAQCDGSNPQCPTPTAKANKTECNNGRQVCWNGICQGSICEGFGLEECTCSLNNQENNRQELCHLCCQEPGTPATCKSSNSSAWSSQLYKGMTSRGILNAPPGAPCNNFQGYCDVFSICREVDADGPLSRLKNAIFNPATIKSFVEWVKTYWWAMILIGLGLVILMAGFIKLCAVHTPSSNPKRPPPRPMSLRRQKHRRGQGRHPPQDHHGQQPPQGQGQGRRGQQQPRGRTNPPPYNPDFMEMQQNPRYHRR